MRRALALTIEREIIAERLMGGGGAAAYGLVPRAIEGYGGATFDFVGRPRADRLAEARALLAAAGYGPDTPLEVDLRVAGETWTKTVASAIVSMWGEAGIKASVTIAEARVHYAAINHGDFELGLSVLFGSDDPETFMWLFLTGGGLNESKYSSAAFDAASAAAETTMDIGARYAGFARAEKILMDDVALIPVFWTIQASLVAPGIDGWTPTPRGFPRSRWASFGR